MRLSEILRLQNEAVTARDQRDYAEYVAELSDRQSGRLIDGTCRVVDQAVETETRLLTGSGNQPNDSGQAP